ncbi:hypothetical protein SASPL_143153 [Salvia splendens]|uniref:Expansin-like CBD domain-containing protein n=1 Tax=Salvia splendens TaxID=180675 RepID=A0A8X8ZA41_SALSN|nr:hypothetical protein SASPL_143153 [Salvia splendens]
MRACSERAKKLPDPSSTFVDDEITKYIRGGDVANMWVKGSKTNWISMSHNWGASYQAFATLGGQPLSFKITSYTSHQVLIANYVTPANWQAGMTYTANLNFH